MSEFVTKSSGGTETFSTGSIRDSQDGKPRYDLISPFGLKRLAELYGRGIARYGSRNWESGQNFGRTMASLERHIQAYKLGEKSEDHLAAVAWNAFALMHYEEAIKLGLLDPSLNDLPRYTKE